MDTNPYCSTVYLLNKTDGFGVLYLIENTLSVFLYSSDAIIVTS